MVRFQRVAAERPLHHPFIVGIVGTPVFDLDVLRRNVLLRRRLRQRGISCLPVATAETELRTELVGCRNPVIRTPVDEIRPCFLVQLHRLAVINRVRFETVAILRREGETVAQVALPAAMAQVTPAMPCSPYCSEAKFPVVRLGSLLMMLMTAKGVGAIACGIGPRTTSMRSMSSIERGSSPQFTAP